MAGALWLASCVFPTDRSDQFAITVDLDVVQLLLGESVDLSPTVLSDGKPVPNVSFLYSVSDEDVAVVSPAGVILGVGEGETAIEVRAAGLEAATPAAVTVFVSRGIVIIDLATEVTTGENTVRFGETLTLTGLRLDPDSLSLATIGGVPVDIVGYTPRDPGDPSSFEQLRMHAPVVDRDAELLLIHRNGGTAARSLSIVQEDVFDVQPAPVIIDLAAGDFRNRNLTISFLDEDWYRVVTPPGDYTIFTGLRNGESFDGGDPFVALEAPGSDPFGFGPGAAPFGIQPDAAFCSLRLRRVVFPGLRFGSRLAMAIRSSTSDTVDLAAVTIFDNPMPYEVSVRSGYHSDLAPDPFEENDLCHVAPDLIPDGTVHDVNFDTVTDFDWYNVAVGSGMQPTSFDVTRRDEVEPNNSIAQAELATVGSRIVGDRGTGDDIDYYAVDLVAGTLLDLDVRARNAARVQGRRLFGRSAEADMLVEVTLYDPTGNVITRNGTARSVRDEFPAVGTDARIRYVVPTSGRYTISVTGEAGRFGDPEFGPNVYYGIDIMAHQIAGALEVTLTGSSTTSDPRVIVVERRSSENVLLLQPTEASTVYSLPVPDGSFFVMVYNDANVAAPYQIAARVVP